MRILFYSTSPWGPSSYSVLTKRVVPEFVRDGHEVICYSWYGLQGQAQKWPISKREDRTQLAGAVTILPHCGSNPYGVDTALPYYQAIQPDVIITNMDIWVMPPEVTSQMSYAAWAPIDHDPVPRGILQSLATSKYVMSYSQWGANLLKDCGVDAHYVPCSADSTEYKPMPQAEARRALGIDPTAYLVSIVAANKDPGDRKGFGEAIQGFAKLAQKHDDAKLYIHSNWTGPIDITNLCDRCGLSSAQVTRPDMLAYLSGQYDDAYMRLVYAASDVLLNVSKSEGFGLPILEAQMCGTPVILSDFSTSRELCFAGWLVEGQRQWSIGADSWRLAVYVDKVADALEEAYSQRGNEVLRRQARNGALAFDTYEVHKKYWRPALQEIEEIVKGDSSLKMVTF